MCFLSLLPNYAQKKHNYKALILKETKTKTTKRFKEGPRPQEFLSWEMKRNLSNCTEQISRPSWVLIFAFSLLFFRFLLFIYLFFLPYFPSEQGNSFLCLLLLLGWERACIDLAWRICSWKCRCVGVILNISDGAFSRATSSIPKWWETFLTSG